MGHNKGHLVGVVLTDRHIIICNSGTGMEYHSIKQDEEGYTQQIIFLDRPDDWQLCNLFKHIYYLNNKPNPSIDIKNFYGSLLRIYYIQIIKEQGLADELIELTKKQFSKLCKGLAVNRNSSKCEFVVCEQNFVKTTHHAVKNIYYAVPHVEDWDSFYSKLSEKKII